MEKYKGYRKKMDIRGIVTDENGEQMEMQDNKDNRIEDVPEEMMEDMEKKESPQNVILKIEKKEDDLAVVDLVNIAGYMKAKWRKYVYLLVIMVCVGFVAAILSIGIQKFITRGNATAVVAFSFEGLDKGLDPNGGFFDVSKMKSTVVVNKALENLGWEDKDVEEIRSNLKIEGVIPDSVKQQIAVINTVAEDATEYYKNIEDLDYFPSQYTVTLQRCKGMSGDDTRELLDAILLSYRDYFMDTYANTDVVGMALSVLDVESYDYIQASHVMKSEINTMKSYVDAKAKEAPGFRANSTGLSFRDLSNSIDTLKRLDLDSFTSFVRTNKLTKDAGVLIDYYNYQIEQYNFEIQELQTQLSNVEKTIASYEKDPVIVMSNQESVMESSQKNEYYDQLLRQKLDLTAQIGKKNTDLNEAYAMINDLNDMGNYGIESDYEYADTMLNALNISVERWTELVQKTAEEYFESELFADAYRIAIPAQYTAFGDIGDLIKRMLIFGVVGAGIAIVMWGVSGLKEEIGGSRKER